MTADDIVRIARKDDKVKPRGVGACTRDTLPGFEADGWEEVTGKELAAVEKVIATLGLPS